MSSSRLRTAVSIAVAAGVGVSICEAQATPIAADFVVRLERTACFGQCPVYSVSIDAKGNVTYNGSQFVRVKGRQTDRVPVSRVVALAATIDRIGFFDLKEHYKTIRNPDGSESMITDLPTAFVTVTRDGRTKRIEDYYGAPAALKDLERQIDDVARTVRWIRVDEQALAQLVRDGAPPSAPERAEMLRDALQHDDVAVVKALVELGADVNGVYFGTNTTPLMMVRSAAAARILLDAGAMPDAINEHGTTPLGRAVNLSPDVATLLLKAGARADQPVSRDGRTALFDAACHGNVDVVVILLSAGADPARAAGGQTALECAQRGRDFARAPRPAGLENKTPYTEDFDRTIALLTQALAKRK